LNSRSLRLKLLSGESTAEVTEEERQMKRTLIVVAVVVVAALVVWRMTSGDGSSAGAVYEFAKIERGDLEDVISATGTISAVGTVEVGTQVSGRLSDIFVDFNDSVREGQVLALIDTTFLAASVKDARANVMKAEAQLNLEQIEFSRAEDLLKRGLVSEADHQDASAQLASARASVLSAEAALDRAKTNLDYAVITSPISGTVIERSVEPGQTVAASLSAPVLFIIAEDLSDMEIHVLVDESDIGRVKVGQEVRFTVDAYYEEEFWGEVRQIRLLPETVSNVVNYTVVVDAPNERGLLLPGMTATADFLIEHREDVLLVGNAALKLSPTMAMWGALRENMQGRTPPGAGGDARPSDAEAAPPDVDGGGERVDRGVATGEVQAGSASAGQGRQAAERSNGGAMRGASGGSPMDAMMVAAGIDPANGGVLWYLDENGKLAIVPVEKGATDGSKTEIAIGRDVHEGMQVITAVIETEDSEGGSKNPLATTPFGRRRR